MPDISLNLSKDQAIGVFDSGIGGITVMKEIVGHLPQEKIIYFADSARFPYGSKSAPIITKFAAGIVKFLIERGAKLIVVACNSASAMALKTLKERFQVPMIGVVEPGARAAVEISKKKAVGIIGTKATIQSDAYQEAIRKLNSGVKVIQQACPMFVALVEEGWVDKEVTRLVAREYLQRFRELDIDVLLLGCTHYPMLKPVIGQFLGERIKLVDSAISCAEEVERALSEMNLMAASDSKAEHEFFITDLPERFQELGGRFLGTEIKKVTVVEKIED